MEGRSLKQEGVFLVVRLRYQLIELSVYEQVLENDRPVDHDVGSDADGALVGHAVSHDLKLKFNRKVGEFVEHDFSRVARNES